MRVARGAHTYRSPRPVVSSRYSPTCVQLLLPQYLGASAGVGESNGADRRESRRNYSSSSRKAHHIEGVLDAVDTLLPPALLGVSLAVVRLRQLASLRANLRDIPGVVLALEGLEVGAGGEGEGSEGDFVWIVNVTVASAMGRRLLAGAHRHARHKPHRHRHIRRHVYVHRDTQTRRQTDTRTQTPKDTMGSDACSLNLDTSCMVGSLVSGQRVWSGCRAHIRRRLVGRCRAPGCLLFPLHRFRRCVRDCSCLALINSAPVTAAATDAASSPTPLFTPSNQPTQ